MPDVLRDCERKAAEGLTVQTTPAVAPDVPQALPEAGIVASSLPVASAASSNATGLCEALPGGPAQAAPATNAPTVSGSAPVACDFTKLKRDDLRARARI